MRRQPSVWQSGSWYGLLAAMWFLLAGGSVALAQSPTGPCASAAARAFDFWIGEWEIAQQILRPDGTWIDLPARTSVTATLDGCALVEHWHGEVLFFWEGMKTPEAMSGLSVRAYDPTSSKWYVHWMDTRSPRFGEPYVGTFAKGIGVFFQRITTPDGTRLGRITFSDIAADSVRWALAVSTDEGGTWRTLWTMRMRRSIPGPDVSDSGRPQSRAVAFDSSKRLAGG